MISGDKFRMVLATTLREDGAPDDEDYDPTDNGMWGLHLVYNAYEIILVLLNFYGTSYAKQCL